jgi:hypothetical protein
MPVGYMTHGITSYEFYKYQELAGLYGRVSNSHVRFAGKLPPEEGAIGCQEIMCNAMVLNAPCMGAHVNSTNDWEFTIHYVNKARSNGHKIFAEAYPYNCGLTTAAADVISTEEMRSPGITYSDIYYVNPHQVWNKEIYDDWMNHADKTIIVKFSPDSDIKKWMADPETILCLDAMPCTNPATGEEYPWEEPLIERTVHPRTSGTQGNFFAWFVRRRILMLTS